MSGLVAAREPPKPVKFTSLKLLLLCKDTDPLPKVILNEILLSSVTALGVIVLANDPL